MMDVIPAKSPAITEISQENGAVFLKSETGVLRIIPQIGGIFRVSFSEDGTFGGEQGRDYADFSGSIPYEVSGGVNLLACDGRNILETHSAPDYLEAEPQAEAGNKICESSTQSIKEIWIKTSEGSVCVSQVSGAITFYDATGAVLLKERSFEPRQLEQISLYRTVESGATQVEEIVTADGVKKKIKAADREEYASAYKTRTYFEFDEDELLVGFGQGERGEWSLRNSTRYVHQANRKIGIPMMVSAKNYGILLSTNSLCMFSESDDEAFIQTEADYYLDYYFLFGSDLFSVIKNYRRLTGKAAMLPQWAYGYIQSKERYKSQEEILETAGEFKKRGIGIDCLVLDWMSWRDNEWGQKSFDEKRFPDPKKMTDELHRMGIRFMMSIWPNMSPGTENNTEFKEKGLLFPGTDIYNAFSKEGRKLYWNQVERALYPAGVDAWWCDSSEPITPEWEHKMEPSDSDKYYEFKSDAANIMPFDMANAYGKYHARTIWEGQRTCSQDKRVVNLTRSGWAGSQKYGTILWSGDISASWDCLRQQVTAGLSMAASGMPYWTLDTGAFFVKKGVQWYWNGDFEDGIDEAYKKLYVRWLQYSAFLPVFRAHGTDVEREPWAFGDCGDLYYEAICRTIKMRYRLIPYLYSLGARAALDDEMIMRPLFFDFSGDKRALNSTDQYMLGDSLMVCPVVRCEDKRTVYLPENNGWYDFYTHKYYDGGQEIECECDLYSIPVFVKAGSLIPVKEPGCCTDDMKGCDIEVLVYPGADASFKLYEDAGDGYGYENGEYCITELTWNDEKGEFSYNVTGDEGFRTGRITYSLVQN
ncbi:glycoside hydrolase family 31 protein [Butyrivibrio sp. VCD2006]|uniref:glycoside hydrolase family 31 protein n=1 Tax=Butyrivibrio sp. VCD2006 TaxID=1280664 RepID=UPI00040446CC|nr:TIM-barrel domain-containing protein [Butyrivibrio sp. VCD2006]